MEALAELEHKSQMVDERYAEQSTHIETNGMAPTVSRSSLSPSPPRKAFIPNLAVFTGTYSDENLLQAFVPSFTVVVDLAVTWVLIINSMFVVLYMVIAFVIAQESGSPPYLLSPSSIGLLSPGPLRWRRSGNRLYWCNIGSSYQVMR